MENSRALSRLHQRSDTLEALQSHLVRQQGTRASPSALPAPNAIRAEREHGPTGNKRRQQPRRDDKLWTADIANVLRRVGGSRSADGRCRWRTAGRSRGGDRRCAEAAQRTAPMKAATAPGASRPRIAEACWLMRAGALEL